MLSLVKSLSSVLKMAEKLCQQSRLVQPDTGAPVSLLELKKSVCGNKGISHETLDLTCNYCNRMNGGFFLDQDEGFMVISAGLKDLQIFLNI